MELYFTIGTIIVLIGFLFTAMFINLFVEELKKEEENVGYIEGLIVYRM